MALRLQPLLSVMFTTGVHRIVESHAATRGHEIALVGRDATLTYRELNQRANALARYFIAQGFRRGSRAVVKMERCPELAMVLLAVLKAGGAYTWLDSRVATRPDKPVQAARSASADSRVATRPDYPVLAERSAYADRSDQAGWPRGISLEQQADGHEQRHLVIDIRDALAASARPAPNLPILTRAADIACVLTPRNGLPGVLVPHAAITALQSHPLPETTDWSSELGALDLWLPLMAGATVTLTTPPAEAAAA